LLTRSAACFATLLLAVSLPVATLTACGGGTRSLVISVAPPAVRGEVRPPRPSSESVWVPGRWEWRDGRHTWVAGHWIPGKPGKIWVPGHWRRLGDGWAWSPGRWQPA
jgi:hypothetical protein